MKQRQREYNMLKQFRIWSAAVYVIQEAIYFLIIISMISAISVLASCLTSWQQSLLTKVIREMVEGTQTKGAHESELW